MKADALRSTVAMLVLFLLASCGGGGGSDGGGNASTLAITVSQATGTSGGSTTTTYTEGPINSRGYYDPSFSADLFPTSSRTLITMCSGVTTTGCAVLINVGAGGTAPGGYSITGGSSTATYILYAAQGNYYDSLASQGTVTLTSVGAVGSPITGSFQAVLGLRSTGTPTRMVSGTFSVIRDH